MKTIRDVSELVEALGGTNKVAADLEVAPPTISRWRSRGEIPPEWYLLVNRLAGSQRIAPALDLFSFRL